MELDAFRYSLGRGQGRIQPSSLDPGSGKYAFVLGEDQPGRLFNLSPGDHAEVIQDVDLTGVDLVRAHLGLRVPVSVSHELGWEASIIVDGAMLAAARVKPGRTRILTDLAANVSKLSGVHQVGVRLELVAL